MRNAILLLLVLNLCITVRANAYNRADTLRGSNGRGRDWWDVLHYDLKFDFDMVGGQIKASNKMRFKITGTPRDTMQIDLQAPMMIDSIVCDGKQMNFEREGNVWWVKGNFGVWKLADEKEIEIFFHGSPKEAKNAPWDGGFSRKKDKANIDWWSVSCQGLGASVWWACKDAQWDEPDNGVDLNFSIQKDLTCISNGRLQSRLNKGEKNEWHWKVVNPINTYDITFYIGDYVTWSDTLIGEKGTLDLDFWVLRYNETKAKNQFKVVKQMMHCFEYWMGPYPFYEDGYKLVDAPYLGMEHQSAIAYGNNYKMGYMGSDRSMSGAGMDFDYIIVHESGHEWFGNSVTAVDMADNWVHEGITTYSETLFEECLAGKERALKYTQSDWFNILNNRAIIGDYGVNKEGGNDMYDKGAAIMHMIRTMIDDDEKFRKILRGISKDYYHSIVTSKQIENYLIANSKLDLTAFFNQYLRTTKIPEVEYYIKDKKLYYRFIETVTGFSLQVPVNSGKVNTVLNITNEWQHVKWKGGYNLEFPKDFLILVKNN